MASSLPSHRSARRSSPLLSARGKAALFATFSMASLLARPPAAQAADATWNVNANGNFATPASWTPAVAPGATGTTNNTDTATFGNVITAARTVTVDTGRNLQFITFDNAAFAYTLSGGSFALTNGGAITLNSNVTAQQIISTPSTIQGDAGAYTLTSNGASTTLGLTISGTVTGASTAGTTVLNLTGTSTAFVGGTNTGNVITGIISNGAGGGNVGVTKTGTGTWALTGANTYTGGVNVQAGTLVTGGSGLGAATNLVTLGTTNGAAAAALGINLSGGAVANPILLASGNTGALTIGTVGNNASVTTMAGGITGSNNLIFSNASTTAASLNISGGVNNSGSITNSGPGTGGVSITGIVGSNVTSVTQNSTTSSLTLSGVNTFTGGVTVSAGSLLTGTGTTTGFGAVSMASGTTLNITGGNPTVYGLNGAGTVSNTGANVRTLTLAGSGNYAFSGTIAPTTAANTAVLINNTGVQTFSGTNTYTAATTLAAGQLKLDFSAAGAPTSNIIAPTSSLALGNGTIGSYTLTAAVPSAGATAFTQTFAGPTIGGGMGHINLVVPAGSANTLTLNLGAFTTGRNNAAGLDFTIPTGGTVTSTTNTGLVNGIFSNLYTVNQTNLATLTAAGTGFNVVPYTAYVQATATTLGTGSGAATNTDFTTVPSTTLAGAATVNTLRFDTAVPHTLTTNGATAQIGLNSGILVTPNVGANTVTITGGFLAGASSRDLQIAQYNTAAPLVINSIIASQNANAEGLTKNGEGTVIVNATNVHNNTYVNEGALVVGANAIDRVTQTGTTTNGSAVITGVDTTNLFVGERTTGTNVTASANGPRIFSITPSSGGMANGSVTLESNVTNTTTGTIVTAGSGTITFNGGSGIGFNIGTAGGDVQIGKSYVNTAGTVVTPTLQIGNAGATGSLMTGQTVTNNGLLTFNRTDTALNFGNVVSGVGGVSQLGTGTVTLSGANTYTGTTSVQAGTLMLGATNAIPAASTVSLGGGTLNLNATSSLNGARGGLLALAANSTIDFGTPGTAQTLNFGNSSGLSWAGNTLLINNYETGTDVLNFGSATGLTVVQLAEINFAGFSPGAQIDAAGNVTPVAVPEPGTWAMVVLGAGMLGYSARRKFLGAPRRS